jgi:thymidylate synthase
VANQINKTQYFSLLLMVAGHCDYKVGKFCHLTQNLHIYDRHYEAANEILNRADGDNNIQPRIKLKLNKNFYDYTVDDFIIYDNIGEKLNSPLELAI